MPACQIEDYQDDAAAREELTGWLSTADPQGLDARVWRGRLAHWWDENPFSPLCPARGWVLRQEGRLVGFMALIPVCYAVQGRPEPAYMVSTWRIDAPHRNASLPMFMKLRRLGEQHLVVDTTPTPEVQQLMRRGGWTACREVRKHFLAHGWAGRALYGGCLPQLAAGLRVTRDAGQVRRVAASCRSGEGIEKWVTPESLRWFAASPMRRHEFVGVVDGDGCLTSHMMLTPTRVRGVPAWLAVDHFTTRPGAEELHALVGAVVRGAAPGGARWLLSLASFPGDDTWENLRPLHARDEHLCHHFLVPKALSHLKKHSVLAEGDWGL